MAIAGRHYRRDLLRLFPQQVEQTDTEYKNAALTRVLQQIPSMDKETTIQAIKCTIREINGGDIDHDHHDLDRLENKSDFKNCTEIVTANLSTTLFGVDKTRGAIIQLFSLCEHLAKLLVGPQVTIGANPTRVQKAQLISDVLQHPTVLGTNLSGLAEKDKLVDADLNVMFTRNRDGNINDLSLGNKVWFTNRCF